MVVLATKWSEALCWGDAETRRSQATEGRPATHSLEAVPGILPPRSGYARRRAAIGARAVIDPLRRARSAIQRPRPAASHESACESHPALEERTHAPDRPHGGRGLGRTSIFAQRQAWKLCGADSEGRTGLQRGRPHPPGWHPQALREPPDGGGGQDLGEGLREDQGAADQRGGLRPDRLSPRRPSADGSPRLASGRRRVSMKLTSRSILLQVRASAALCL